MNEQEELNAKFKAVFNSITDAIVVTNPQRQIVLINPAFTELFGYQLEDIAGQTTQVFYATQESYLQQGDLRYSGNAKGAPPVYNNEYRRKDGTVFSGETLGSHLKDENDQLLGFLGVIRDVSERIAAEKRLKESEDRYRALHDATFGGVAIHDKGLILECNQGLSDITGFSKDELIGMNGLQLIAKDSLDTVLHNIKTGYAERYEVEGVRKDGSVYPLSIKGKNVVYKGHQARVIEFRDVTAERLAEKALRESEERFRATFETNPDPVILATLADGKIIDVNKAFEETTGISRLEALGHDSEQLGLWKDKDLRKVFLEQLEKNGEVRNLEADFNVRGGEVRTGLLSTRILQVHDEPIMLLTVRDITSEKEAEQALRKMDQLKSDFISTAAHELRTPLTAIMGYTDLLLDPIGSPHLSEEAKRGFLLEVMERSEILNRMIKDFFDLSRIESGLPLPIERKVTDIYDVLRKTVDFYQLHEAEHSFRLDLPEKPSNPLLNLDQHRICQVIENLLSNAAKYSPAGSNILISGKELPTAWQITVEDHGMGMNPSQVEKIFNKFYRADMANKKVQGLGLGMSIVKHIVDAHDGAIRVESTEGKGTTITLLLPFSGQG